MFLMSGIIQPTSAVMTMATPVTASAPDSKTYAGSELQADADGRVATGSDVLKRGVSFWIRSLQQFRKSEDKNFKSLLKNIKVDWVSNNRDCVLTF